jgi:hypothetical protein
MFVSVCVSVEIGAAVTMKPTLALLPVMALGGLLLLVDPRSRLLFLVFGGLLTLQSSGSLGQLKLAYLAGIVASCAGALFRFSQNKDFPKRALAMPLLRVSIVFLALVMLSLLVARAHGVQRTDWLRDVAPYLLFALGPLFAFDAQSTLSRQTLVRILVIAGTLATLAFATRWVEQRHIAELPFSRFALSSFFFPAALFTYAIAAALHSNQRRRRWIALSALVFALLIVTGTRTTLILVIAPIVVVIGARRHLGTRWGKLMLLAPAMFVLIGVAAYSALTLTHASTAVISERISVLKATGNRRSDGSYADRLAQSDVAKKVFYANPIFGAGPGTSFEWRATNRTRHSSFILDSPVSFPAKFGIVGLAAVAFLFLSYVSFLRAAFRFNHPRVETLAVTAYAALGIAGAFLWPPLEDKGYSLGLILLLALVLRTSDGPASPRVTQADRRLDAR